MLLIFINEYQYHIFLLEFNDPTDHHINKIKYNFIDGYSLKKVNIYLFSYIMLWDNHRVAICRFSCVMSEGRVPD